MSLTSEIFLPREDGSRHILGMAEDPRPDGTDLAGPESWRTKVWGSPSIRRIGARFLPALVDVHQSDGHVEAEAEADGDVVTPGQIPAFLDEIALVRAELTRLATETCSPDRTVEQHARHIESRLDAIEASARYARRLGGGLLIW
ncbi:hypothetical protein P1P75_14305 [Streptomyces sp. ID05-39B]|uniref:hypothetical protein n=1 Tax=Streptomyces sp. ID05-39B TaxID=3028664 RepID=UPI0029A9996C|nr:hypothetical protein [Streptomyces sp. ID05-39B]MDX3527585.1 hypothetical protein [Streptomyces sp. ID05-39B]